MQALACWSGTGPVLVCYCAEARSKSKFTLRQSRRALRKDTKPALKLDESHHKSRHWGTLRDPEGTTKSQQTAKKNRPEGCISLGIIAKGYRLAGSSIRLRANFLAFVADLV